MLRSQWQSHRQSNSGRSTLKPYRSGRPALADVSRGIVDVYWEYTGTSLTTFNHVTEKLSPDETYARVKALDGERGLVWLSPSKVDNTYALAMRQADAATKGISSISDLARKLRTGDQFRLAST